MFSCQECKQDVNFIANIGYELNSRKNPEYSSYYYTCELCFIKICHSYNLSPKIHEYSHKLYEKDSWFVVRTYRAFSFHWEYTINQETIVKHCNCYFKPKWEEIDRERLIYKLEHSGAKDFLKKINYWKSFESLLNDSDYHCDAYREMDTIGKAIAIMESEKVDDSYFYNRWLETYSIHSAMNFFGDNL